MTIVNRESNAKGHLHTDEVCTNKCPNKNKKAVLSQR